MKTNNYIFSTVIIFLSAEDSISTKSNDWKLQRFTFLAYF